MTLPEPPIRPLWDDKIFEHTCDVTGQTYESILKRIKKTLVRSRIYIDHSEIHPNIIEGMISLMYSPHNEVFNLGYPEEISVLDLAKKILKKVNSNSNLVFKDACNDDPLRRKPSITKAKEKLHWEPKISFDDGLNSTIKFFTEQQNI